MTLCEIEKLRSERNEPDEEFEKSRAFREYDRNEYRWGYVKSPGGLNLMYIDRK